MAKYRKKPVVIEAIQWRGDERQIREVMDLFGADGPPHAPDDPHIELGLGFTPADGKLYIPTLEGTMTASPDDWIIRGVRGEVYPCKPDIFAATYEAAE
jgi:hypothetical protein